MFTTATDHMFYYLLLLEALTGSREKPLFVTPQAGAITHHHLFHTFNPLLDDPFFALIHFNRYTIAAHVTRRAFTQPRRMGEERDRQRANRQPRGFTFHLVVSHVFSTRLALRDIQETKYHELRVWRFYINDSTLTKHTYVFIFTIAATVETPK